MNDLKFQGEIKKIFEKQSGTSNSGKEWSSVEFLVKETSGQYPQSAKFRISRDSVIDNFLQYNKVGDIVEVSFNLLTNEYEGNYYNSLSAWKIWKLSGTTDSSQTEEAFTPDDDEDDLPF